MAEINRTEVWMWDDVHGTEQESYAVYDAIQKGLAEHMRESVMLLQRRWHPLDSLVFTLDREKGEVVLSTPDPEPLSPEAQREEWLSRGHVDAAVEYYMGSEHHEAGWYVECSHCPTVPVPQTGSMTRDHAVGLAGDHVIKEHGIQMPVIHEGEA